MKEFLDYLRQNYYKYNDIVFTAIEYEVNTNILRCRMQYVSDTFSDNDKFELEKAISSYFNNSIIVECKVKKYIVDCDVIQEYIMRFIQQYFPSCFQNGEDIAIKVSKEVNKVYSVQLKAGADNYAYLEKNDFVNQLSEHLQLITREEYNISLQSDTVSSMNSTTDILQERYDLLNSTSIQKIEFEPIEVANIHNIVGEIDVDFVYPIASIQSDDKVVCVGTISRYAISEYKSRYKNKDGSCKINKKANFVLEDGSGLAQRRCHRNFPRSQARRRSRSESDLHR